jgi:two-component system, sensor histidine kinase
MNTTNLNMQPKVLIVDDDPLSIFLSERLLKSQFQVTSVLNGEDAVKIASETHFDAILVDVNLGNLGMNGIHVMQTIRTGGLNGSSFISAFTSFSHSKKWYLDQGFDEVFIKPMTMEIIASINNHIFNSGLQKAI